MFGYIVPFVPELKVRQLEVFRSYYCGLCRTLKKRYGKIEILNYDATFLYMVLDALSAAPQPANTERCILHPVAGRPALISPAADYAADINMLMAWAKAQDDTEDEGGVASKLRRARLKRAYRKAALRVPAAASRMESAHEALRRLERENTGSVDAACHPYAELLGEVFADGYVLKSHILRDLGYNLGRWVYMVDALDDMEGDAKEGRYNVFANRAAASGESVTEVRQGARFTLFYTLSQAQQALKRLELERNGEILQNIIGLGLRQQTESVLSGAGKLRRQVPR